MPVGTVFSWLSRILWTNKYFTKDFWWQSVVVLTLTSLRVLGWKPAHRKPFPATDPLQTQLLGSLEIDYYASYSLFKFKHFILCGVGCILMNAFIHGKTFVSRTETRRVTITCWVQTLVGDFTLIITGRYCLLWNCNSTIYLVEWLQNILRKVSWYLRSQDWKPSHRALKAMFLWPLL